MSSSTPTSIQPGWYEDPQTAGMLRWFDGVTWSPFTKPHAAVPRQAAVPQPRTAPAAGPAPAQATDHSVAAARAALLAADSGPIPVVLAPVEQAPAAPPAAAAAQPVPATRPAVAASTRTVARPARVPAQRPQAVTPVHPASPAARPVPSPAPQAVPPAVEEERAVAPAVSSATTAATDRLAAIASAGLATWPSPAAAPTATPSWGPPGVTEPDPGAARGPTALRRLVGRLAEDLPPWLPAAIAGPLSLRMVRYATRTDRFRDRLTAESLKRLVFPDETAWQTSLAACLGVLTIALSVWPLAGFGAWLVTCAFAGLGFRRLRREVLLGGSERAWFGIACGVGPLWTGLLALVFR